MYYPTCTASEAEYVRSAFELVLGQGAAPDSRDTLRTMATRMGWQADDFVAWVDGSQGTEQYAAATHEAIERKVFGVPTMVVGDAMWWGNDRLFMLERHLKKESSR